MTIDRDALRRLARSWLTDNSGQITATRERAINEEVLAFGVIDLLDENDRLAAEDAAWSDLCNKQNALLEEKYRVSDSNVCGWCRMAAGDPEQLPADVRRYTLAEVREHTLTCANNPLVAEANKLRAALREALMMANDAGDGFPYGGNSTANNEHFARIDELRKLAGEP